MELRQLSDPKIRKISISLEFADNEKFILVDGLVYKKEDDQLKFVVPEAMVHNILRVYHDDMAHCGREKTYYSISQNY